MKAKAIFFICSCIFPAFHDISAQTDKFPVIDLTQDITAIPEPALFKKPVSHYQIVLETNNHNGFDTAQWVSEYYNDKGQLLRTEINNFSSLDKVQRDQAEGQVGRTIYGATAKRYAYDQRGNVTDEMHDRLSPANSIAALTSGLFPLMMKLVHPMLRSKNSNAADEEKYAKHYLDSLIAIGLPGSTELEDSLHTDYDDNNNPLATIDPIKNNSAKNFYSKNGSTYIQGILRRISATAGHIYFFSLEEHQVNYKGGRINSVKSYRVAGDSSAITASDTYLVRSQANYYDKRGLTDSVIFHELNYFVKHNIMYNDKGSPISHVVLNYGKYDNPRHWDTVFMVNYSYAKRKLSTLLRQSYFAGKRANFAVKEYTYNEKDQPLEIFEYLDIVPSDDHKRMFRKHRYYYTVTQSPNTALPRVHTDFEGLQEWSKDEKDPSLQATQTQPADEKMQVSNYVEQMPEFNGNIDNYLSKNLRYPESARKEHRYGIVIVRLIVKANGNVDQPEIIKGVYADLNEEALRLIRSMPAWKPGKNNGRAVDTYFTLPVSFRLE